MQPVSAGRVLLDFVAPQGVDLADVDPAQQEAPIPHLAQKLQIEVHGSPVLPLQALEKIQARQQFRNSPLAPAPGFIHYFDSPQGFFRIGADVVSLEHPGIGGFQAEGRRVARRVVGGDNLQGPGRLSGVIGDGGRVDVVQVQDPEIGGRLSQAGIELFDGLGVRNQATPLSRSPEEQKIGLGPQAEAGIAQSGQGLDLGNYPGDAALVSDFFKAFAAKAAVAGAGAAPKGLDLADQVRKARMGYGDLRPQGRPGVDQFRRRYFAP